MTDLPREMRPYRVPRTRMDDVYDRNDPLPYVKVGGAEVVAVGSGGETCTVDFGDETVAGVVILSAEPPEPGDWVEVATRGNLLVVTDQAGGGGTRCYVQPDEPAGVPVGTLWFDTDETLP